MNYPSFLIQNQPSPVAETFSMKSWILYCSLVWIPSGVLDCLSIVTPRLKPHLSIYPIFRQTIKNSRARICITYFHYIGTSYNRTSLSASESEFPRQNCSFYYFPSLFVPLTTNPKGHCRCLPLLATIPRPSPTIGTTILGDQSLRGSMAASRECVMLNRACDIIYFPA